MDFGTGLKQTADAWLENLRERVVIAGCYKHKGYWSHTMVPIELVLTPKVDTMSLQVMPDWTQIYTIPDAIRDLQGFEFRGPGIYMHGADTVLVTPCEPLDPKKEYWQQDKCARYLFCVYNTIGVRTILTWMKDTVPHYMEPGMKIGDLTVKKLAEKLGIEEGLALGLLTANGWNFERAVAQHGKLPHME